MLGNDRPNRRRSIWIAIGATIVVVGLIGQLCFFAVDAAEYALVTEFGKPVQIVKTPGLGFKYPYQSVRTFDKRLNVYVSSSNEFLTLEKTPVVASSNILWRVADPKRFFETVFDRMGAESRLGDILFAELGAAIGRSALTAFVSVEPGTYRAEAILAEVANKCHEIALKDYGIDVADVQLQSFDFPKQNRARVYARMTSERGRMSMKYRSEGDEEGAKVRAAAEGEKTNILTEALKLAQQHRGEGEGEAARIYAEALAQGPEFYRFLRTMEASRNLVPKGTTLVLAADSELFGVLYDSNHYNRGDSVRTAIEKPRKERSMR